MESRRRGKSTSYVLALVALLSANTVARQSVTRIYVEPFGSKGGDELRAETIKLLKGQKEISIVDSEAAADRVLSGTSQTYIKGYLSRNPRIRYRNSDSRPVYGGYLSVELKDQQDETLWSYLVTPNRFGSEDINRNLADQIVSKLLQFLSNPSKTP